VGRPFSADELQAVATRRTGLSDFGDLGFRADLAVLLDALNHDAQLHAAGRMALRRIMTDHLVNRLLLTSVRQQAPGIFTRPLANPLIVTGLPRSGTTLLHRMLAADPATTGRPTGSWPSRWPHRWCRRAGPIIAAGTQAATMISSGLAQHRGTATMAP
jgi:hypothetical protein